MHLNMYFALQLFLLISIETTYGRKCNNTKSISDTPINKKNYSKNTSSIDRLKRSLDENDIPFWPQRGRRLPLSDDKSLKNEKSVSNDLVNKDQPFWGTRGRRDSSSSKDDIDDSLTPSFYYGSNCKSCNPLLKNTNTGNEYYKERRQDQDVPFWGNRGRRNSEEFAENNYPYWGNRGRRQEEDPFWGARGRRQEDVPFRGNRGRRYVWGDQADTTKDLPFWGNRGRRDEGESFWAIRGRNQESDPFWGSRGRKESKGRRRENLKKILNEAINAVEDNIENLIRSRKDDGNLIENPFWEGGREDNQNSDLFKFGRHRYQNREDIITRPSASRVDDDRIYAEQPHYIMVERSSRSSGEDDPFFISRGKKIVAGHDSNEGNSNRNRRGAIEELVKSVRNDPYYIARGKKNTRFTISGNSSNSQKDLNKAKELICATIDLMLYKNKGNKVKREVDDNDRDRRTILKKLAAQLQIDPYFVSRGKKNESSFDEDNLADFIKEVSVKCN